MSALMFLFILETVSEPEILRSASLRNDDHHRVISESAAVKRRCRCKGERESLDFSTASVAQGERGALSTGARGSLSEPASGRLWATCGKVACSSELLHTAPRALVANAAIAQVEPLLSCRVSPSHLFAFYEA